MDNEQFQKKINGLIKYSNKSETWKLIDKTKVCDYCHAEVKNQRIECNAYRLGTPHEYFKHICRPCGFVLFDGSMIREPHRRPDKPIEIKNTAGRRRSREVQTPDGVFPSLTKMAEFYKKTPSTMLTLMKKKPTEYYYI